jgi:hypothetical protein
MDINFNEKLAICYTCSGPTYRKTVLDKLNNFYFDNPNLYYFVITDDKNYFKDVVRQNFVVNELKDFQTNHSDKVKQHEYFIESNSIEDYVEKFIRYDYKYPFSVNRFHLLQTQNFGIQNIAILGTDADITLSLINDSFLQNKNIIYNAVSAWFDTISENKNMRLINDLLDSQYKISDNDEIMIFDAAARLFIFNDTQKVNEFFNVWNDIVIKLCESDEINNFIGSPFINDELILAPIYKALSINPPSNRGDHCRLFEVKHNREERFWTY